MVSVKRGGCSFAVSTQPESTCLGTDGEMCFRPLCIYISYLFRDEKRDTLL